MARIRAAAGDPHRLPQIRRVVDDVVQALARPVEEGVARLGIFREVWTDQGVYIVRGRVMSQADAAGPPAILVTLTPESPEPPSEVFLRIHFGLTAKEARVARLVALARSNADIARALYISPHTARHHTQKVLSKLGVRSRHDVGRRLFEESRDTLRLPA